jgi:hypothetical protein
LAERSFNHSFSTQTLATVLARGEMGYNLNNQICKQVAKEWQIIIKNKKMGYSINCNPLI